MKNYIVRNCPSIEDIADYEINKDGDFVQTGIDTPDYCVKNKKQCKDITDCVMKRIYERCELYEFNYPVNQAIQMLTQNIENMLEIEEVDD